MNLVAQKALPKTEITLIDKMESSGDEKVVKTWWGLSSFNGFLYASDGSENLYKLNPDTLAIEKKIAVHSKANTPINMINSLCVISEDHVLFNRYETNNVYLVNLKTGEYIYYWDFSSLKNDQLDKVKKGQISDENLKIWNYDSAMNGIAWLGGKDFLLTGKMWSGAYKVSLNNLDEFI